MNIASVAEVEAVDYFLMLLDASAVGGEEVERAISTFTIFFKAQTLRGLRRNMVGWRIPFWVCTRSVWWSRPILDGLVLRTLFQYLAFIDLVLGKIMNIRKPKFASSIDLTLNSIVSQGCSTLVSPFMAFSLF